MGESKRPAKRPSKQSSARSNPPPPPARRQASSGGGGGAGRSVASKGTKASKSARSSRAREKNTTPRGSRSRSRPREGHSRSRSKSRPREGGARDRDRDRSGRPKSSKDDRNRSRSKSRPRDASSKRPQAEKRRPSGQKQSSKKFTAKNNTAKSRGQKNGTRSSPKKQPSAKKRERYAANARKAIPASVRMISGSHDAQTSADVSNVSSQFKLPSAKGRSGGACTAALLQVLYESHERGRDDVAWVDVLRQMRGVLQEKGYEQIPQLTSSRMIDVHDPFVITPTDGSFSHKNNTQRAVLIGINYTGQSGQLSGCHNDVHNVSKYLTEVQGFRKENITILLDDGKHKAPTKSAILSAFKRLVKESKEGDVAFCHFSGHGGRLPDDNGDEDDGYDETLIPVDFKKAGQLRDDDLLKILVHPMPEGVTMTCLMDCCHSGTVLDLPYRFTADGDLEEMVMNDRCNFKSALWSGMGLALGMAAGNAAASAVASAVVPQPEMMILGGGPNAVHEYSDTGCCVIL